MMNTILAMWNRHCGIYDLGNLRQVWIWKLPVLLKVPWKYNGYENNHENLLEV